jgi:hypothetical protein
MELVVSSDGRGAMSSRPEPDMQPVTPNDKRMEAKKPAERISTLYAQPNRTGSETGRRRDQGDL